MPLLNDTPLSFSRRRNKKKTFVQEHTSGFRSTVAEQIDLGEKPCMASLWPGRNRNADEDDGTSTSEGAYHLHCFA